MSDLLDSFATQLTAVEQQLDQVTSAANGSPARLTEAIRYSVLSPGKRMRPLLSLLACEAVGGEWEAALPGAVAVELIHVYSLIHDDLPAMDDDDLRRGKPTCHKQFDEATAILAGDSLQMLAIEHLCQALPPEQALASCHVLANASGRQKLVGGQQDDLAAEGRFELNYDGGMPQIEFLKFIHRRKTGALIEASLKLGGIAGNGAPDQLDILGQFGLSIGLAFQIVDDCLDVESTSEQMGKKTGKDSISGKLTYPGLLGLEPSKALAKELLSEAKASLAVFQERSHNLARLADFVLERKS